MVRLLIADRRHRRGIYPAARRARRALVSAHGRVEAVGERAHGDDIHIAGVAAFTAAGAPAQVAIGALLAEREVVGAQVHRGATPLLVARPANSHIIRTVGLAGRGLQTSDAGTAIASL